MLLSRDLDLARRARRAALALFAALLAATPARAHPQADLEVGDPREAEVRVLDLLPGAGPPAHAHTRPLRRGAVIAGDSAGGRMAADRIAAARLERALWRDREGPPGDGPPGATPWLFRLDEEDARFEVSAGLEGTLHHDPDTTRLLDRSGVHVRGSLAMDRWIVQTHWLIGQVDSAQRFADPLIQGEDVLATVEQAIVAYHAPGERWGARFGRGRWHWGPGREASLLLSRTSAPLTALAFHASVFRGRLHVTALSATLKPGSQVQYAAHRVEWQAHEGLRLGVSEGAVYHADGWRPLYLIGLLPYTTAQRLDAQDEPGSLGSLRNNVMVAVDAAWRFVPGSRIYGEVLIDDLHAKTRDNPDKIACQVGWEGVGTAMGSRIRWNGEYTRLTRFVYTSFFGAEASSQGRPLGFPTGPDARQLALFVACDPHPALELSLGAKKLDKGENRLGDPFEPGVDAPHQPTWRLLGIVERTRDVEARVRWWPASGIDLAVAGGYTWRENAGHVAGRDRDAGRVMLEFRVTR
jgi:hypothetical protein